MAIATGMRSVEKLKLRFEYIDVLMALTELAMNSVVAVGAAMRRRLGADVVAAAGAVLDRERLAELVGQPLRDQAGGEIGGAAGRGGDDDAHRPRRIGLREGHAGQRGQHRCGSGDLEKPAARDGHGVALDQPSGNRPCFFRNSIMRRLNSQGCSIWQACPAPGSTFNSQFLIRSCSGKAFGWVLSSLPVRMIDGQAIFASWSSGFGAACASN